MKKLKSIDKNYLFIIIFCFILLFLVIPENYVFGSKVDWVSQHIVFPDYFRKLFYKTGNLFPNFALSIGAGQNIYNFSYYGLLNPLILLSYLFPMVSMKDYIIFLNQLLYIIYGLILYCFLKTKTTKSSALITTLILVMASPVLFHFHKHFMFVNYLPFLILALIGVDHFFQKQKRLLLVFSTFMIIMTSYYYSICCIGMISIYAFYCYLQENEKIEWKKMLKKALQFLLAIIIGIGMSAILILPTFYVLKTGRTSNANPIDWMELLLPTLNLDGLLYGTYSAGLTFISLLGILIGIQSQKKEKKFLSLMILLIVSIPLFIYTLNGGLYVRNKILIPIIPLIGIILCQFIEKLQKKEISLLKITIIVIITVAVSSASHYLNPAFYLDAFFIVLIIALYYKNKINKKALATTILLVPLITLFIANSTELYMNEKNLSEKENKKVTEAITETLQQEKNLTRFNHLSNDLKNVNEVYITEYNQDSLYSSVSNPLYKNFYENIFHNALSYRNNLVLAQNNDILFQTFMGVKYIYSETEVPVGYQKIGKNLYQNNNVLPMIYGTDQVLNEKEFDGLLYPYNVGALLDNAITTGKTTTKIHKNSINKVSLEYEITDQKNIEIKRRDEYLRVKSTGEEKGSLTLKLKEPIKDKILIINIEIINRSNCRDGDLRININGIDNVLTCKQWIYKNDNTTFHYVISSNEEIDKLKIKWNQGTYKIKNIETYQLDYSDLADIKEGLSEFKADLKNTKGDQIIGKINMKSTGYLVTSIPYDKGFKVYVDNKRVQTEIVNKAFLGLKLEKGSHQIKIIYQSPWFNEGKWISILSCLGLVLLVWKDRRKEKQR